MRERLGYLTAWIAPQGPVRLFFSRGSVLLAGQLAAAGLAVVETVFLARALGVAGYGQLALVIATVVVAVMIVDVRVWETATRFGVDFLTRGQLDQARTVLGLSIGVNAIIGIFAGGLVMILAELVAANLLGGAGEADALRLYAVVAPFSAIAIAGAGVLRVLDAYRMLAWLTIVVPALRAAAAVLSATLGLHFEAIVGLLVGAEAVGSVVFTGLAWQLLRRRLPAEAPLRARVALLRPHARPIVRFMALSSAVGSVRILNERGDILLVGAVANPATVGIFKMARTFTQPLGLIVKPYFQVIYPQFTQAASRGALAEMRRLAYRSMIPMATVLVPMALVTCALGPFVIPLLVGPSFAEAAQALVPLAAGWAISGTFFWLYPAALALDAQKMSLAALVGASALQLVLLLVLVPVLGAVGAGLAWMLYSVAFVIAMVGGLHRRMRFPSPERVPAPAVRLID